LSAEDIARVELDLGFYLQRSESLKKEFELRWFAEKNMKSLCLSHSHSDFDGGPQIAASLWLELENEKKQKSTGAGPTRWDSVMSAELPHIQWELGFDGPENEIQRKKISLEFGLENYEPVPVTSEISVSAGSLKKFFDCPFQFYVEKVLKLKDQNEFDLDVDPMFQGQIWHKMVEEIHKQYPALELTREQLSRLYDEAAKDLDITSPLKKFWLQEKSRHLIYIRNFLELEREWRAKFTTTQTVATESAVTGYIGIDGDRVRLASEKINDSFHPFNGRIDRVDRDSKGHLSVIDYKSSSNDLKTFKSWASNGLFQMPLYALALEAGLAEETAAAPVMAASYIIFKDKSRGLGYILDKEGHEFGDLNENSRQFVGEEDRDKVFSEILGQIKDIFARLRMGFFKPEPRDEKICDRCQWSRVCRAPHLK
jgi:RecB family exonuclease